MKFLKAMILLALTAILVAPLSSASAVTDAKPSSTHAQRAAAAALAGSGCSAYVQSIQKPGNYIQLRAMVSCNRVVDQIRLKAFITRGEGNVISDFVTCQNRSVCSVSVTHPDKSGIQHYWGGPFAGNLPPATVVWDNGSTWYCGNGMSCTYDSADF